MISVRYRWHREDHHLRLRGTDPLTGEKIDSTVLIEDDVFAAAHVKRTAARAERVARDYAVAEEARLNDHGTLRQRAAIERTAPAAPEASSLTIEALWTIYRARNAQRVKPATLRRDATSARHLIEFFDEKEPTSPERITIARLEAFAAYRAARGSSPRDAWNDLAFMKHILTWSLDRADDTGLASIAFRKLPEIRGKEGADKVILSEGQIFALYRAAEQLPRRGDVLRRIIAFGVSTRLRLTPLLALRGEWIDRQRMWIDVPGRFGKFDKPASLPLTDFALHAIEDLPASGPLWTSQFSRQRTALDATALRSAINETNSVDPLRDQLVIILTQGHRVRAEDVAALEWSSVDLAAGTVAGVHSRDHYKAARTVQLAPDEADMMRRHRRANLDAARVFTTKAGPMKAKAVYNVVTAVLDKADVRASGGESITKIDRSLAKACKLAGVPTISAHGLRRAGAQLLTAHRCEIHRESTPKHVVSRLMEHGGTALERAYGFVTDEEMREAVARIDCAARRHLGGSNIVQIQRRRRA